MDNGLDGLTFYRAGKADLELLVKTRVEVLRAANLLGPEADLEEVRRQSRRYYETCFDRDAHAAYLVLEGDEVVGAGGISFYQVMPTVCNPTGRKAYVMNMYTRPDRRRRGIASRTLTLLLEEARSRDVPEITLEATAAGRPLYLRRGFAPMENEMEYRGEGKESEQ